MTRSAPMDATRTAFALPRAWGEAHEAWRRAAWWRHLGAVGLLVVVAVARYGPAALSPEPLPDEAVYLRAFAHARAGESPYARGFYYLPVTAVAGATAVDLLGEAGAVAVLRTVNLVGVAVLAWLSLAWAPPSLAPWRRRLAAASALLALSPAVRLGVQWGNATLAVSAATLVALVSWPRRPVAAGLLLGLGTLAKPLAAVVPLAIAVAPTAHGRRPAWTTAATAAVTGLAFGWIGFRWLGDLLRLGGAALTTPHNVAPHRLLHLLGLDLPALGFAAAVAAATAVVARRHAWEPATVAALGLTASLAATPLVWAHSLLLGLPVQAIAVGLAWERRRDPHGRARFAILAGLAGVLHGAEGVGGVDHFGRAAQIASILLPALGPATLVAFALRECRRSTAAGPPTASPSSG